MAGMIEAPGEPTAGEAGPADLSQGYCVEVCAYPDGTFGVSKPEPLESTEPAEGETPAKTVGEALKALLALVKANPVGSDGEAAFEAGYSGGA